LDSTDSERPDFFVSFEKRLLQPEVIHAFLTASYWSPGISRDIVDTAISNSLTVGAFDQGGTQIGFARLVTDFATFGYLADVFVTEKHRGKGIASQMTNAILERPEVKRLRRIMLATRDAHGIYERAGFERILDPTPFMQIVRPNIYREASP
jgi:GNAT superfamily N-acetyltransferase